MGSAVHRVSAASIPSESLWAELAESLRRVTVRIDGRKGSHGAGVVWNPDGLIVTNAHVVDRPAIVGLHDGRRLQAELIQLDRTADLAALRIPAKGLHSAEVRDARTLRAGEMVIAVGHPLGTVGAVSTGIVHTAAPGNWIQTDVRLAPGNSGGPLADAAGRVVGINSMVANGIGVAVSTGAVHHFLSRRKRARLGVTVQPALASMAGVVSVGLLVVEIEPGGSAHLAGIVPGDLLVRAGVQPLLSAESLAAAIGSTGAELHLDLVRDGVVHSYRVSLQCESTVEEGAG